MMTMAEAEAVELADCVALLAAHIRGDEETCRELLGALGPDAGIVLLGHAISLLIEAAAGALPGGRAELLGMFTSWQERRRGQLLN
jgi:hypothetical protein